MDSVQLPQGYRVTPFFSQKPPFIGVLIKICFEDMQPASLQEITYAEK